MLLSSLLLALSYHFPAQRSPLRPTVAVRTPPPHCAAATPEALEAARELLRQEALRLEEEEKAAQQSAVDAAWERLAARLPSAAPDAAAPVLTLYRDTNGWCPFCEKVWLQLMAKGVPFETELVNLQDKPAWYKEMVPTNLVPAVKLHSDGAVVWESAEIMRVVEERFSDGAEPPLLPAAESAERAHADAMVERASELSTAGFRFYAGARNASLSDGEKAERRATFEAALDELDGALAAGGGPFMLGDAFSLVDAAHVPFLERWAVQLPLTAGFHLRGDGDGGAGRWPRIDGWFDAMDGLPYYSEVVKGDAYSWAAAVSTFMRIFSGGDPTKMDGKPDERMRAADAAAAAALKRAPDAAAALPAPRRAAAKAEAARRLIANHAAVVDGVGDDAAPKSQPQLKRLDADEADAADATLRAAAERLLMSPTAAALDGGGRSPWDEVDGDDAGSPATAASCARAARYVAARTCAPRDMGAEAAAALRAELLAIAGEAESFAWSASGGLL